MLNIRCFKPNGHIFDFLDTNGDGSGETNAIAPGDYYFEAKRNKCELHRMLVNIVDDGRPVAETYGNGVTLTDGINVILKKGDQETYLTKRPILVNADWNLYCYDATRLEWTGPKGYITVRWSFYKSGAPLLLDKGDKLIVRLGNDDYSLMLEHRFHIQGVYG